MPVITRAARARIAVAMLGVMACLAVAVPLLDAGDVSGPVAVATDDGRSGPFEHDHRICLQHGAAVWVAGPVAEPPRAGAHVDVPLPGRTDRVRSVRGTTTLLPRAPPTA